MALDFLPNEEGSRSQNVAPRNIIVVDHLRLFDDLLIPLGEVIFLTILDSQLVGVLELGLLFLLFSLGFLFFCKFDTLFLLWLVRFSTAFLFLFFAWCSRSNRRKIQYLEICIISASELLDLVYTLSIDDRTSCVIHWVETCPFGFIENFIVNELYFVFLIIYSRSKSN